MKRNISIVVEYTGTFTPRDQCSPDICGFRDVTAPSPTLTI